MKTIDILNHLEKLVALKTISELGSIRKASETLQIAQPSLSVKIKILEEQLELTLLERSRQGVILTKEGQQVLSFVSSIVDLAEELKVQLEQGQGRLRGHIRIGMYDSIARYIWPDFYKSFSSADPDISISISTGRSHSILEQLENHKLDLALTVEPHAGYDTQVETLYKDTFSFYCSKRFANQNKSLTRSGHHYQYRGNEKELIPFILFSKALSENGIPLEQLLKFEKNEGFVFHRVESFEIAHAFCLEDIGIAVLPQKVAQREHDKGRLFKVSVIDKLPLNFGQHRIGLSVLNANKNKPLVEHITKALKNYVHRL